MSRVRTYMHARSESSSRLISRSAISIIFSVSSDCASATETRLSRLRRSVRVRVSSNRCAFWKQPDRLAIRGSAPAVQRTLDVFQFAAEMQRTEYKTARDQRHDQRQLFTLLPPIPRSTSPAASGSSAVQVSLPALEGTALRRVAQVDMRLACDTKPRRAILFDPRPGSCRNPVPRRRRKAAPPSCARTEACPSSRTRRPARSPNIERAGDRSHHLIQPRFLFGKLHGVHEQVGIFQRLRRLMRENFQNFDVPRSGRLLSYGRSRLITPSRSPPAPISGTISMSPSCQSVWRAGASSA